MMSGLVTAGVNAEQTLPYYAVLSAVAAHLTHQVRDDADAGRLVEDLFHFAWIKLQEVILLKRRVLITFRPFI